MPFMRSDLQKATSFSNVVAVTSQKRQETALLEEQNGLLIEYVSQETQRSQLFAIPLKYWHVEAALEWFSKG